MKVIHINEEFHGHIGTAVSMRAAFQHLVDAEWITPKTEFYINGSWAELGKIMWDAGLAVTRNNIVFWCMQNADNDELWDGMFYFSEDDVIEEG
jgi:hypothetical protein